MATPIDETKMAEQREIVARVRGSRMPFAHIGRLWHSKRRHSYGVRFAASAELIGLVCEDGTRWEPLEAVVVS